MKKETQTVEPVSDGELREIERSTVLLAEVRAGFIGDTAEAVLSDVFTCAANSGATPLEVLKGLRRSK